MSYKSNSMSREDNQAAISQLFQEAMRHASSGQVRIISPLVSGKEITLAHVIGTSIYPIYKNLGLDIGFHAGDDPTGRSIGLLHITPAESVVIAADIAVGLLVLAGGALIYLRCRKNRQPSVRLMFCRISK